MTMRPALVKRYGTLATVALLVLSVAVMGMAGSASLARASGTSHGLATHAAATPLAVHPAPARHATPAVGPVSVAVTITNAPKTYIVLPYTLSWDVAVTNGSVSPSTTWMSVTVLDINNAGTCVSVYFGVAPCPTVVNLSANSSIATGVTSYSLTITNTGITSANYNGGVLPADQFQILVWVTANNGVSNLTFGGQEQAFIVPFLPSGGFVAPLAGAALSTGNVTLGVNYTGNYISGATLTIYQGTGTTGKVVYTQGVFQPGTGPRVVIATVAWFVTVAGSYFEQLNITAPYGTLLLNQTLTVIPSGQTIYQNSSSYQNTSAPWGGTSTGEVAALLLVVGLIIGMIVALALGRAMWGTPKTTPAQAWQSKPTNECSVCHQTFATDAELKEHQKSAHGM